MLENLKIVLEEAKAEYAKPEHVARAEKVAARARRQGIRHQISRLVTVRAGDVVAAVDAVKPADPVVQMLRDGSAAVNPDRTVQINLEDLERLVEACSPSQSVKPRVDSSIASE